MNLPSLATGLPSIVCRQNSSSFSASLFMWLSLLFSGLVSTMEDLVMEVNLCPSSNFGLQASCSILIDAGEDSLFSRTENQAVVRLEHSVTAVCPENGEIQYTTVIPHKNIDFNGKVLLNKIPSDTVYKVNRFEEKGDNLPTAQKSLLRRQGVGHRPGHYDINNKPRTVSIKRDQDMAILEKVVHYEPSRNRKRKNPDTLDYLETEDDEKKHRKNKQWSQASMQNAIIAVRNGMRVRRAAKEFAVPRTTLKYKLDGRAPLQFDTELSTSDLSKKITKATKDFSEAQREKRISGPPQAKQMKDKVIPETGKKNSATKNPSGEISEKNKVNSSSHDVLVQHTRSLRSNSNILEKKNCYTNRKSN